MDGVTARNLVRSLPVKPGLADDFIEFYVAERIQVRTPKQLKAFTKRWNMLWKIPWMKNQYHLRTEEQLVSGKYDAWMAMKCLTINTDESKKGCFHIRRGHDCISAHILAPYLLMKLTELTLNFGIPEMMAMVQLQRSLHKDIANDDPALFVREQYVKTKTSEEDPEYFIMYDCELRKPGCVILQALADIPKNVFFEYFGDTNCWLLHPTPNLKKYPIKKSQLPLLAAKTDFSREGSKNVPR